MATAAIVGAIALTAGSVQQSKQAAKETKKANKVAQKQANSEAARKRRQQVRQARIKQGEIANTGAISGIQGSSSAVGAASSVQAQMGSNIGFLNSSMANQNSIFRHTQKAADFSGNAGNLKTFASLSGSFAGMGGAGGGGGQGDLIPGGNGARA